MAGTVGPLALNVDDGIAVDHLVGDKVAINLEACNGRGLMPLGQIDISAAVGA